VTWPTRRYEEAEARPSRVGPAADREPAAPPAGNTAVTDRLRARQEPTAAAPGQPDRDAASVLPAMAAAGNAAVTRLLRGPAVSRRELAAQGAGALG